MTDQKKNKDEQWKVQEKEKRTEMEGGASYKADRPKQPEVSAHEAKRPSAAENLPEEEQEKIENDYEAWSVDRLRKRAQEIGLRPNASSMDRRELVAALRSQQKGGENA